MLYFYPSLKPPTLPSSQYANIRVGTRMWSDDDTQKCVVLVHSNYCFCTKIIQNYLVANLLLGLLILLFREAAFFKCMYSVYGAAVYLYEKSNLILCISFEKKPSFVLGSPFAFSIYTHWTHHELWSLISTYDQ